MIEICFAVLAVLAASITVWCISLQGRLRDVEEKLNLHTTGCHPHSESHYMQLSKNTQKVLNQLLNELGYGVELPTSSVRIYKKTPDKDGS